MENTTYACLLPSQTSSQLLLFQIHMIILTFPNQTVFSGCLPHVCTDKAWHIYPLLFPRVSMSICIPGDAHDHHQPMVSTVSVEIYQNSESCKQMPNIMTPCDGLLNWCIGNKLLDTVNTANYRTDRYLQKNQLYFIYNPCIYNLFHQTGSKKKKCKGACIIKFVNNI